jgi:hypothetical protein
MARHLPYSTGMRTQRPQVVNLLPMAARATIGLTRAMTTTLGALVLVTSLVPVFAVCMAALGARPPDHERLSRSSGSARGCG